MLVKITFTWNLELSTWAYTHRERTLRELNVALTANSSLYRNIRRSGMGVSFILNPLETGMETSSGRVQRLITQIINPPGTGSKHVESEEYPYSIQITEVSAEEHEAYYK